MGHTYSMAYVTSAEPTGIRCGVCGCIMYEVTSAEEFRLDTADVDVMWSFYVCSDCPDTIVHIEGSTEIEITYRDLIN